MMLTIIPTQITFPDDPSRTHLHTSMHDSAYLHDGHEARLCGYMQRSSALVVARIDVRPLDQQFLDVWFVGLDDDEMMCA